jgi:hypothetical protein
MNFDYDLAVRNARVLVEQTRNAGWELARICSEVAGAGIPARTFAEDVGISRAYVEKLVRTWDRCASRRHEKRSFAEFFVLANTTPGRAERLEAVAESEGISVSIARNRKLVPADKARRPDLLAELVAIRLRIVRAAEAAKVAAEHMNDVSTFETVANEIREAADQLVTALTTSELPRLKSVR